MNGKGDDFLQPINVTLYGNNYLYWIYLMRFFEKKKNMRIFYLLVKILDKT